MSNARATNVLGGVKVGGVRYVMNGDYNKLINKPKINDVELQGNKTSEDLHIHGGGGGGTTYAFSEGGVDGAFQVTPDGGDPQSVKVHGLKDHCFEDALTEDEILTILNHDEDDVEEDDTE